MTFRLDARSTARHLATIALALCSLAVAPQSASQGRLQTALDPNPGLRSSIADAVLVAQAKPLPVRRTFHGTAYYLAPTGSIVFADVPPLFAKFRVLSTTLPSYAQARADFVITPLGDDGKRSIFTLVPKNAGSRVASLRLAVDDAAGVITQIVYGYRDGSTLTFDEQYQTVATFTLVSSSAVAARFTDASVTATIRFSNYRTNVAIPPDAFTTSDRP
jgi:hypothetical protein